MKRLALASLVCLLVAASPQKPPISATDRVSRGEALLRQGKSAEAEVAFRAALKLKPDDPQARDNLARFLKSQGGSPRR